MDRARHLPAAQGQDVKTMRAYRMTRTTTYAPEANVEMTAADLAFP
jgi:hypothetical protein